MRINSFIYFIAVFLLSSCASNNTKSKDKKEKSLFFENYKGELQAEKKEVGKLAVRCRKLFSSLYHNRNCIAKKCSSALQTAKIYENKCYNVFPSNIVTYLMLKSSFHSEFSAQTNVISTQITTKRDYKRDYTSLLSPWHLKILSKNLKSSCTKKRCFSDFRIHSVCGKVPESPEDFYIQLFLCKKGNIRVYGIIEKESYNKRKNGIVSEYELFSFVTDVNEYKNGKSSWSVEGGKKISKSAKLFSELVTIFSNDEMKSSERLKKIMGFLQKDLNHLFSNSKFHFALKKHLGKKFYKIAQNQYNSFENSLEKFKGEDETRVVFMRRFFNTHILLNKTKENEKFDKKIGYNLSRLFPESDNYIKLCLKKYEKSFVSLSYKTGNSDFRKKSIKFMKNVEACGIDVKRIVSLKRSIRWCNYGGCNNLRGLKTELSMLVKKHQKLEESVLIPLLQNIFVKLTKIIQIKNHARKKYCLWGQDYKNALKKAEKLNAVKLYQYVKSQFSICKKPFYDAMGWVKDDKWCEFRGCKEKNYLSKQSEKSEELYHKKIKHIFKMIKDKSLPKKKRDSLIKLAGKNLCYEGDTYESVMAKLSEIKQSRKKRYYNCPAKGVLKGDVGDEIYCEINGKKIGRYTNYHDELNKESEGFYVIRTVKKGNKSHKISVKNGIWRGWYEDGKVKYIKTYVRGKITAKQCFSPKGKSINCKKIL